MFKKGMFYRHKNSKDIIIEILYSLKTPNYYKLKIAYWNISPRAEKPWPILITDKVRVSLIKAENWSIFKPYPHKSFDLASDNQEVETSGIS